MKKRLIRSARIKTASQKIMTLKSFISKSGMYYSLDARLLGNKIYYSVTSQSEFSSASLYDGLDYERAFQMFCELAIAIKGINFAETMATTKDYLMNKSQELVEPLQNMTLKVKNSFLGDSENVVG